MSLDKAEDRAILRKRPWLLVLATCVFVACWSSGYLAARFTQPFFEPFNLLLARYVVTTAVLALIVFFQFKSQFITAFKTESVLEHLKLGFLYHVVYIGCVFYAVKLGLSAGVTALILATQPLATIVLETFYSRKNPGARIVLAAIICLVGTILATNLAGSFTVQLLPTLTAAIGVAAISYATVRHARVAQTKNVWLPLLIQFVAGTVGVLATLFLGIERFHVPFTLESGVMVLLLVIFTTLGSYVLMTWLITNMPTALYANIFYLVPPAVMVAEFLLYGEAFTVTQLLGSLIVLLGIFLGLSKKPSVTVNKQ